MYESICFYSWNGLRHTSGKTFWEFIEDGGYQNRGKGIDKSQFYRFSKPRDTSFPAMIELFSTRPSSFNLSFDGPLIPIHIDNSIISLSAIMLDDDYYDLLRNGKQVIDGYSLITIETVILFKMKAWLDLKNRKGLGERIDSKTIKKHKNDVFRLLANVDPHSRLPLIEDIQKKSGCDINEKAAKRSLFRSHMNSLME